MKPFVLGVCGGSGSGKSTLAFGLQDAHPGKVTVIHLDDYFKKPEFVPEYEGVKNWDDPEALRHADMAADIAALVRGESVEIMTKSPRLNPGYPKTRLRIPVTHDPAPLIVVEGFYILHYPDVRPLLNHAIFLDVPIEHSSQRRANHVENEMWYREHILLPMHHKYVVPSQSSADEVVDAAAFSPTEVLRHTEEVLKRFNVMTA